MLATITAQSYGLTSIDLKALREADRIVFRRHRDGRAVIECIKKLGRRSPWEDDERIHEIPVLAQMRKAPQDAEGFHMIYGRYDDQWQTIVALLRAGDQLELEFWADSHTNDLCRQANFHVDSLRLHVRRGEKRMVFLLSVEVYAGDLAWMIRR